MPTNASAKKRLRSNNKKRLVNRARKSRLKTSERRLDEAITANDKVKISETLTKCFSELDKASKKGTIHKNKANRKKARLAARAAKAIA